MPLSLSGSSLRNLSCPALRAYFGGFVCSIFEAGELVSCLLQNGWLSLSVPALALAWPEGRWPRQ